MNKTRTEINIDSEDPVKQNDLLKKAEVAKRILDRLVCSSDTKQATRACLKILIDARNISLKEFDYPNIPIQHKDYSMSCKSEDNNVIVNMKSRTLMGEDLIDAMLGNIINTRPNVIGIIT